MPGISSISKQIDNKKNAFANAADNREVFLYDGSTIAVSVMSNGEDDNVDNIFRHYVPNIGPNGKGRYIFCRNTVNQNCWVCESPIMEPKSKKPQMMFAFWGFVHTIRTENKPSTNAENWTTKTVGKKTVYEMAVNDPRIISLPVGREEVTWDSFVEIHQMGNGGEGGFDKVINISRKGSGMTDTVYRLMSTGVSVNVDEMPAFDSVENLHSYFLSKSNREDAALGIGNNTDDDGIDSDTVSTDDDDGSDLPF